MKMKKVMSLLLAVMILLSLSACAGNETKTDNDPISSITQNQTDETDTSSAEQSVDTSSSNSKPVTTNQNPVTPDTPIHTHNYSNATCTAPAKCSCGATKGNALGHNYDTGICKNCGEKDSNYKPPIEKIELNTAVTVSSNHSYRLGDLKITVLGFEKTTWKADEYRYNEDDPDGMHPAFKALGETEEIGMLKLVINKISYDDPENPDNIWLEDVLKTYDEYDIALNAINTGWRYGSYKVALNETVDMKKGETTRVAVPYIYDTSNNSLRVILGERYEVTVPIVQ